MKTPMEEEAVWQPQRRLYRLRPLVQAGAGGSSWAAVMRPQDELIAVA
ncbi:hypothetical protein [Pseudoxanthomonas dokdonensis]|nr:hypothetical protein [Pseudoxanthomonas dokdonensis]